MFKSSITVFALLAAPLAFAQVIQRDMGDFSLKLGTTPSRSMAQGLVAPSASGSFHGGLDITHESGWYMGQYAPSMGLSETDTLQLDSYVGYKHPFDSNLGYELGMINYSYPNEDTADAHEVYAGLRMLDTRFGAAFSDSTSATSSTLFADLGSVPVLDLGFSVKVTNYQLSTPYTIGEGSQISSFSDWSMQLSRPWLGIDLDLIYSDSNLRGADCAAYSGHNTECDSVFTLKAERSFY